LIWVDGREQHEHSFQPGGRLIVFICRSFRPNGDRYVYALTDYREFDRSIALARL
jgi:hypothetical protein